MLLTYVGTADDEFLESVDKAVAVSVGVHPTICNSKYRKERKTPKDNNHKKGRTKTNG